MCVCYCFPLSLYLLLHYTIINWNPSIIDHFRLIQRVDCRHRRPLSRQGKRFQSSALFFLFSSLSWNDDIDSINELSTLFRCHFHYHYFNYHPISLVRSCRISSKSPLQMFTPDPKTKEKAKRKRKLILKVNHLINKDRFQDRLKSLVYLVLISNLNSTLNLILKPKLWYL